MMKRTILAGVLMVAIASMAAGCGVKGPPKPPKSPVAKSL